LNTDLNDLYANMVIYHQHENQMSYIISCFGWWPTN